MPDVLVDPRLPVVACPRCGYDGRGLVYVEKKATCPECGGTISVRSVANLPPVRLPGTRLVAAFSAAYLVLFVVAIYTTLLGRKALLWTWVLVFVTFPPFAVSRASRDHWRLLPEEHGSLFFRGVFRVLLCWVIVAAFSLGASIAIYVLALYQGRVSIG